MKKLKVLAASVALAFSATSHAAFDNPNVSAGSSLFLVVWQDNVVTYARNLGINMATMLNNAVANLATGANSAWVSESGALFDKTTYSSFGADSNWTTVTGISGFNSSNLRFTIAAAEQGTAPISLLSTVDGTALNTSNASTNSAAGKVNTYFGALTNAVNFNPTDVSCASSNSCFTTKNLTTAGSASAQVASNWGSSWGANVTFDAAGETSTGDGANGLTFSYWRAPSTSGFTLNVVPIQFANSAGAGRWYLENDGDVRYELAGAVPIPGALWLFGSGLLGLIGISRRRKVAQQFATA